MTVDNAHTVAVPLTQEQAANSLATMLTGAIMANAPVDLMEDKRFKAYAAIWGNATRNSVLSAPLEVLAAAMDGWVRIDHFDDDGNLLFASVGVPSGTTHSRPVIVLPPRKETE